VTLLLRNPFLMKRTVLNNVAYGLQFARPPITWQIGWTELCLTWGWTEGFRATAVLCAFRGARPARSPRGAPGSQPEVLLMDEPNGQHRRAERPAHQGRRPESPPHWGTTLIVAATMAMALRVFATRSFHRAEGPLLGNRPRECPFRAVEPMGNGLWGKSLGDAPTAACAQAPGGLAAAVIENVTIMPQAEPALSRWGRSHCPA